jgi:hypothetical protein
MNCLLCYEDIKDDVYYANNNIFIKFDYCYDCLQNLLKTLWFHYIQKLKTIDCEASLQRLLGQMPQYFTDACINHNQPIYQFKYQDQMISGLLQTSLTLLQLYQLDKELKNIKDVLLIKDVLQKYNL